MEKSNKPLRVYATENEKKEIKEAARNSPQKTISKYLKSLHINAGVNKVPEIITNDLTEFTAEIYNTNQKMQGLLNTIKRTNDIQQQDIDKITDLLNNVNTTTNVIMKTIYTDRLKKSKEGIMP